MANLLNWSSEKRTRFKVLARLTRKTSWALGDQETLRRILGTDRLAAERGVICEVAPPHPALPPGADEVAQTPLQSQPARWLNRFARPSSNALAEGFNRVIQALKSAARGSATSHTTVSAFPSSSENATSRCHENSHTIPGRVKIVCHAALRSAQKGTKNHFLPP
ncbi:MAG: transposase [Verrucomicrobiales bacterium]|nr:transposase [Verrucomicrobiales bacterium]